MRYRIDNYLSGLTNSDESYHVLIPRVLSVV